MAFIVTDGAGGSVELVDVANESVTLVDVADGS